MSQYSGGGSAPPVGPRTFSSAIAICLSNYVGFSGRAPRSEYWYFVLFEVLVFIVARIIDHMIGGPVLVGIWALGFLLPRFAVLMRRLHDTDRSGWWWLIGFIPILGSILLLIWVCTRGTEGPNRFGPDPLGGPVGWGRAVAA